MLRIAHVSDLHVLSPVGVEWRELLFNKRITGYANLVLQRGRVYRRELMLAVLAAAASAADQVVVTGDLTNLALESEYDEARVLLDNVARSCEVTVVPGNHDVYLPSTHIARRFPHHFGPFLESDLPELAVDLPAGRFPCVKLRGPAAIIGLSSAVPRPPLVAAGHLGDAQLAALARVLAHPEVARRLPVIALHHPPLAERGRFRQWRDGLADQAELRAALGPLARGLVLFGHLHRRTRQTLTTRAGALDAISATGASLDHRNPAIRAGFNLYEIGDDGAIASSAELVIDAEGVGFGRAVEN